MSTILILFSIALAGIIVMISRKLAVVKNLRQEHTEENIVPIPNLKELRYIVVGKIKKLTFVILVITIRLYVKSANFLKKQSKDVSDKIKGSLHKKNSVSELEESPEVSGFLKMISEYKQKVKRIKRKIHEEEKES